MLNRSQLVTAILIVAVAPALAEEGPTVATGVVEVDQTPLLGAPSADAKTFPRLLMKGQEVQVVGRRGAYLEVAARAFVHGRYVSEGRIAHCSFLNVRATRNGKVVKVLSNGTPVRLTGRSNGDWLEIETVAYVDVNKVTRAEAELNSLEQELQLVEDGLPLPGAGAPLVKLPALEIEPIELPVIELPVIELEPIEVPTIAADVSAEQEPQTGYGAPLEVDDMDLNLSLAEAEELLKELEADPDGMFAEHQDSFADRAEFDAAIVECRELCKQLRAEIAQQADPHGIAGSYQLNRSRLFGTGPKVVLTIRSSGLRDHYVVDRTRINDDEVVVNTGGVGKWDAKASKLEVEWDRSNGVAQVLTNGKNQGDDGWGSTAGDYRIQASTGEIRGNFASPEEGWNGEKGWRENSIQPLEGVYQLKPSWYAFGNKPITTLTVGAPNADGTCPVTREAEGVVQQGVGKIDGRDLEVEFPGGLDISYEIKENGKIHATWRLPSDDLWDDNENDDYRAEKGWRNEVPQDEIPNMLQRGFGKLKGLFGK